jgi:hypothetical protein
MCCNIQNICVLPTHFINISHDPHIKTHYSIIFCNGKDLCLLRSGNEFFLGLRLQTHVALNFFPFGFRNQPDDGYIYFSRNI